MASDDEQVGFYAAFDEDGVLQMVEADEQPYERTPFLDDLTEAEGEAMANAGITREQVTQYAEEWEFAVLPILQAELAAAEARGRAEAIADLRGRAAAVIEHCESTALTFDRVPGIGAETGARCARAAAGHVADLVEWVEAQTKPGEVRDVG